MELELSAYRAMKQAAKAIRRGDYADADRWMRMIERRLAVASRLGDLAAARHRPKPLPPLPPPPPPPPPPKPKRAVREKDPEKVLGYINPWVWPASWSAERIAQAETEMAEERKQAERIRKENAATTTKTACRS